MNSSGTTALATSGDGAITLLSPDGKVATNFVLVITDLVPSFLSMDGGSHWGYLPAATSSSQPMTVCLTNVKIGAQAIMLKRVSGGTNLVGIYAWAA